MFNKLCWSLGVKEAKPVWLRTVVKSEDYISVYRALKLPYLDHTLLFGVKAHKDGLYLRSILPRCE